MDGNESWKTLAAYELVNEETPDPDLLPDDDPEVWDADLPDEEWDDRDDE